MSGGILVWWDQSLLFVLYLFVPTEELSPDALLRPGFFSGDSLPRDSFLGILFLGILFLRILFWGFFSGDSFLGILFLGILFWGFFS